MPETSTQAAAAVPSEQTWPEPGNVAACDGGVSPGDRLTVGLFFIFFAILGFAVLGDLLAGLLQWGRFFP